MAAPDCGAKGGGIVGSGPIGGMAGKVVLGGVEGGGDDGGSKGGASGEGGGEGGGDKGGAWGGKGGAEGGGTEGCVVMIEALFHSGRRASMAKATEP